MRDFKPLLTASVFLVAMLGFLLLLMWGAMETLKSLPEQFEHPTPASTAITGGNLAALSVPSNLAVRHDGCSPTRGCAVRTNYYDAGSRTIVLQPGEGYAKEVHERLHAHQHMSINGGESVALSDYDLGSWYESSEGQSFMAEVGVPNILWSSDNCPADQNGIEAFACVGQLWYNDPTTLNNICEPCYRWAGKNLP